MKCGDICQQVGRYIKNVLHPNLNIKFIFGMNKFLILFGLFGLALTRPQNLFQSGVVIVKNTINNLGTGKYDFDVETSDGSKREETGELKNVGTDNESLDVEGSYSYVGEDGKTYVVNYTADENGFQPEGDHIPPSAGVKKHGISSAAQASLIGGGLG